VAMMKNVATVLGGINAGEANPQDVADRPL
jgi:hypothetical protein